MGLKRILSAFFWLQNFLKPCYLKYFFLYIYEVISIKLKKVFTRIILTKLYMGSQRTFSAFFCLKFFFIPFWFSEYLFYKPLKLAKHLFINTVSTYHFSKNLGTIMNISWKLISLGKYPSRVFLLRKFKEYCAIVQRIFDCVLCIISILV